VTRTRTDRKPKRQAEAKARQAEWDALDDFQRRARHAARGYIYTPKPPSDER